jgi:hypothetical protein
MRGCDQCITQVTTNRFPLQRRVDGKTAVLDVGQQMGEIALKRKDTVVLAERIDKRGI